jgi:hypothetical protein
VALCSEAIRDVPGGSCSSPQTIRPDREPLTAFRAPLSDECGRRANTSCAGARPQSYSPVDTGIVCGSGSAAFDIFDQGAYQQHAIRYYDSAGNLTRRVIHDDYTLGQFSNPVTGTIVPYTQHNTTTDVLATPGDLGSATTTTTGENNFTVPGQGSVFLNAGKVVVGADGSLEFRSGPQNFLDYFVSGNTAVIDQLCAALA